MISASVMDVSAKAGNDYTEWKQYDSAWNKQEAWPKSSFKNATMRKMSQAGCVVTSIAMLLRHYNIVNEADVNKFNPWIVNEKLKAAGAFNSYANLIWGNVSKAYPSFKYAGSKTYSLANITELYNSGYACLIKVSSSPHYVAVRSVNGSKVTIMDPGYNRTSLASYSKPILIQYYSVSSNKPQTIAPAQTASYASISDYNVPGNITQGSKLSVRGTISSTTKITSITVIVNPSASGGTALTGMTVRPNTTSYSIAKLDPYIYFDKLPVGEYYYRITVTNSAGTKILVNSPFNVIARATPASIASYNTPGTIRSGKAFSIKGLVKSDTKLTDVTAGVYTSASGGTAMTGARACPNTASYSLTKLDPYIYFNKLKPGTYWYRVTATNGAGTKVLINVQFRVS